MKLRTRSSLQAALAALAALAVVAVLVVPASAAATPYLNRFAQISTLASAVPVSGPAAGDQNPYGVAVVPGTVGDLVAGDVLVSNFNNSANAQGTGSSIMEVSPSGAAHVFAVVPQPTATPTVGLTTALVALHGGFVIVGSLPAPGGMSSAMTAGALTVLNADGNVVANLPVVNGPWDMTAFQHLGDVTLFVTNVLNGTVHAAGQTIHDGTVERIRLHVGAGGVQVQSVQVIATGFGEHTDPNALVVGPTGVALGADGTLYVADSVGNRIAAIPDALTRTTELTGGAQTLSAGGALNDPLGLTVAPGGDLITVNGANGNALEFSPSGMQVAQKELVPMGAGDLFGLAVAPDERGLYFVNDSGSGPAANSLQLLH
jgi:hypothetical protein